MMDGKREMAAIPAPAPGALRRGALRLLVALSGACATVLLLPWALSELSHVEEQIIDQVGVYVPRSAEDVEADCDDAFMDQTCWVGFSIPREDEDLVRGSTAIEEKPPGVLERRLREMGNHNWNDVEISRGGVSSLLCLGDDQPSEILFDRSSADRTHVYVRSAVC